MSILRHRRSRSRIIAGSVLFLLAIGPFHYWIASIFQFHGEPLWICIAVFSGNFALGSYTLWAAAKQPNDFECELTETAIRCVCPVNGMGSTFDIAIDELKGIEAIGDDPPRIELLNCNGTRVWLTSNFGNPARQFVSQLRTLCPDLEYVEK